MYDDLFQYKAGGENGYPSYSSNDGSATSGSPLNLGAFGDGSSATALGLPGNGHQTDLGQPQSDTENAVGNIYIPT